MASDSPEQAPAAARGEGHGGASYSTCTSPAKAHGEEPWVGPRLSERSLAAAQGEPLLPERGVQHQRSAAYMARQQGKRLTKEAQKSPWNSHLQRIADQLVGART